MINGSYIALGPTLRGIPEVITLGVKANFSDYSVEEKEFIYNSEVILFPSLNYAQFLTTMGKKIFPSLETYLYADEKIKQTNLFYLLGIPHPLTRVYYHLHHEEISGDFDFPFIAKLARRSARGRGVFLIQNNAELVRYLEQTHVAYIQEYLPHERDVRVVLINYQPILAYWRIRDPDNFRSNLAQGGKISFDPIPAQCLQLATDTARKCRLNDVGLDLVQCRDRWYVIEANMKYGRKALKRKGINTKVIIKDMLISGKMEF